MGLLARVVVSWFNDVVRDSDKIDGSLDSRCHFQFLSKFCFFEAAFLFRSWLFIS